MARKKKDSLILEMPGTIGSAKLQLPTVVKGSHLTVTTYPDGRTELEWDDAALERDVREAIESYEMSQKKPSVRAKSATRKKKD
jgi:hypothetical protein